jgi:hypothetical protein
MSEAAMTTRIIRPATDKAVQRKNFLINPSPEPISKPLYCYKHRRQHKADVGFRRGADGGRWAQHGYAGRPRISRRG